MWEFEAIEVFKGRTRVGERVQLWGGDSAEYSQGDESLLFIHWYDGTGDSPCTKYLFSNYRQIHNWCCKVKQAPSGRFLVFYEMLDSETRGPDILVPAERVFSILREFRKSPPVIKKE